MNNNYNNEYQYNSCVSRGICSVNPKTSSLMEIVILYLKQVSYYAIKLKQFDVTNIYAKNFILNTISITVSNYNFSEVDFDNITKYFNMLLPDIVNEYDALCKTNGIEPSHLQASINFDNTDIIKSLRTGEQEFLRKMQNVSVEVLDLYKILFVLAKSICINILDLETFGEEYSEGYFTILESLNTLNESEQSVEKLKIIINKAANISRDLMYKLRTAQVLRYGKQRAKSVSYTTEKGNAILVVGSNIRELELVLESVKNENIDIYTHDEMMLAHTFPKFDEYKNLKGQYGQGIENCLLDFATFPGPIILTRHSLYNIENLYRGRLYTTDIAYSKGVIPIKNGNFTDVIRSAVSSKGFKTGKYCETETVGFNYEMAKDEINKRLNGNKYSRIVLIGLSGYTKEEHNYFDKLFKILPNDTFIVSLSCCKKADNILCFNACFDTVAPLDIAEYLMTNFNLPLSIFFPKCDRHTISKIIYLILKGSCKIFIGKCTPIILNPNLINTLNKVFGINEISTIKKDAEIILKN